MFSFWRNIFSPKPCYLQNRVTYAPSYYRAHLRSVVTDAYWPSDKSFKSIKFREDQCPPESDIVIIGGGLVGMSVAFWLRWTTKSTVTVIERDPSYTSSASLSGLGSIRQQFSEPENIQMSLFGIEFLRNVKHYLSVLDDTEVDIGFNPQGCLMLADITQAQTMHQNYTLQKELGAKVQLFDKKALQERWPWLNVSDIELGCYGYENEGWFDPGLLLKALLTKCSLMGVNYIVGELIEFETAPFDLVLHHFDFPKRQPVIVRPLRSAVISLPDGQQVKIAFAHVVNAAGPWAADVARLAEIGCTEHLHVPLAVEPRLHRVYVVRPKRSTTPRSVSDAEDCLSTRLSEPGLDAPFLIDSNRMCVERRGLSGEFIVYSNAEQTNLTEFVDTPMDLQTDLTIFQNKLGKELGYRIPSLASVEVKCAWTGACDYNTIDQNLIIGVHSYHKNMYLCNGSSGHGAQHAAAIGRAISELIIYGHYKTIDLTRFSFDRFYLNETIKESNAF